MPIDASLFMQFAQQRDAQNQALANSLNDIANQMQGVRLRREEIAAQKALKGFDIDGIANQAAVKAFMGGELTPQEQAALQAKSLFEGNKTTYQPDANGVVRAIQQPTIWDRFTQMRGDQGYQGSFPSMGQPQTAQGGMVATNLGPMPQIGMADLIAPVDRVPLAPPATLTPQQAAALDARGDPFAGQAPPLPSGLIKAESLPYGATNLDIEAGKANIDVQKQLKEADIKASQAGAEKTAQLTAESNVTTAKRNKGLADLGTNINRLIEDAKGTPSGAIEGMAANVSEFVGYPTEAALKRATFASGKAIAGLQSRIAFLQGQGTITDAEAKQAMAFIPDANDPYDIKINKLEAAKQYISGLMGNETPIDTQKPGFRYLGIKK